MPEKEFFFVCFRERLVGRIRMDLLPEAAAGLNLCCGDVWATAFLFHRKVRPMK